MFFDGGHKLSRRAFARVSAASIAAMLASGCRATAIAGGATPLRFWNGFTGPDGKTMLGLCRRFNATNEDVQVTMQRLDWGTYYNKLFVAGLGGRAPEVFVVHSENLERFFRADFCSPVDGLFGSGGLDPSDFDPNVIARSRRGERTYSVPLDVHPVGAFYNRALFESAGVARPPETRAEFLDACTRLRRADQWGFVYDWLRLNCYTFLRQWGGDIVSADGTTVTLDAQPAQDAMAFAASLILELKLAPRIENLNAFIGFRQGKIGMLWAGIFMLQEVVRQGDLAWGAAPVPMLGDRPATYASSHNLCIRSRLDGRAHAAAERFVRFLSDRSLDWAAAGQIPCRPSLRASDRFKAMPAQSAFARQIPRVAYMPSTPYTFEYQAEFDVACERILRGSATPAVALGDAAQIIRAAAARFGPANDAATKASVA